MLSTPLALPAFTLLFFITAFQIVFAYPHQYEHDFLHGGPAWMRTQMAKAEVAKRENMCPNLPAPESWFDYSVKVRVADGEDCSSLLGPASQFVKRDYTCDENTPCSNGACCATTGNCGYGSDYCGDRITPNSVCWSNCDAFAECGKDAQTVNATCPLNVCCSQFGFCGVTSDFCTTGCQSNCEQPTSGSSGSDVQSRILGYYETWKYDSSCAAVNLQLQNVPIGSLTHLVAAFGYITPDTYEVTPMTGVDSDVITQLMAIKSQNPGSKIMISLGGWSFTDNQTVTQPVFTTMVSTKENRATFITNLFAFLTQYGFDGVDFDWEYPGAGDRGGNPDDGLNYATLFAEIQIKMDETNVKYVISCTTPSSYYYLQNLDLFTMMAYVDFTNLMAYDLHGTWDGPKDQIGSVVLAHTNLTEIEAALDLFWRVGVDPSKINLGIGFYGRAFQLSDPTCWQPGCPFKGGANPGQCTATSGILSYNEITQVIAKYDITPYWDQEAAVKYMTWDNDQWVSYDDQETFQQKIKWANGVGLGGLAIWAIDQDTDDLQALQGLLYPKTLNAFYDNTTDSSSWQQVQGGQCRLTDCGGSCIVGEILITTQGCDDKYGNPTGVSQLCCPVDSAPDPKTCTWRGDWPACNGRCHDDEVALEQNKWGDSTDYCLDGNYVYCCALPEGISTGCRETDCGGSCNSGSEISIAGKYFDNCVLKPKQLCCPAGGDFTAATCHWQGQGGSCYNNVCAFDTEIQLAASYDGGGENCGIQLSRDRVFCCTAPGGEQPFLPVPLEYLFTDPPTDSTADTDFKLAVDDTWGGQGTLGDDDTPNDAAFGFFVMTSPETIQISLRKRDGSHWEVFDCNDALSEEAQTVRMFCNDNSENSNCHKIHLGHGVPGTILEMPKGCGPGTYAVAVGMQPASNQSIPGHIKKRTSDPDPVIYDLTFDYNFKRVPQDLGTTQWRLDYSNEEGYWNKVVDAPGQKRRKRSLEESGGSHKRYLEESWHSDQMDHAAGLISRDELHERWFGSSIVEWLKGLFDVASLSPSISHSIQDAINVVLLDEQYQCTIDGVDVGANLLVEAQMNVVIDTSFGLTIVATLGLPPDLSGSYLYFKNSGTITSLFTIDALVQASYDTGDIELFGLENFGATFSVPGILTVGPNFRIFGSVNMDLTLSGKFQAETVLAKWDTQLAFPEATSDEDPQDLTTPSQDGTQDVGTTAIDWSISANGQITAHVKPMISFGIEFNTNFISIDPTTVNVVADGYVQFYASASTGSSGTSVCYGANAGADLSVQISVPSSINWLLPGGVSSYPIYALPAVAILEETCPITSRDLHMIEGRDNMSRRDLPYEVAARYQPQLSKRSTTIGPLIHIPTLSCPSSVEDDVGNLTIATCPLCDSGEDDADLELYTRDGSILSYRDGEGCDLPAAYGTDATYCLASTLSSRSSLDDYDAWEQFGNSTHQLDRRLSNPAVAFTLGNLFTNGVTGFMYFGAYPECGEAPAISDIKKYYVYASQNQPCDATINRVAKNQLVKNAAMETDHVYEKQTLTRFFMWLASATGVPGYNMPLPVWVSEVMIGVAQTAAANSYGAWKMDSALLGTPDTGDYVQAILVYQFGRSDPPASTASTKALTQRNLALVDSLINQPKGKWFGEVSPDYNTYNGGVVQNKRQAKVRIRSVAGVFQYLNFQGDTITEPIWNKWMRVSNWIDLVLYTFDSTYPWTTRIGEPTLTNGGTPSMRALYAYWIDQRLNNIETTAAAWSTAAQTYYVNNWQDSTSPTDLAWVRLTWSATGMCSTGNNGLMRFPRPGTGPSNFGAYGNAAMTFLPNGNTYNIPVNPTRI